MMKRLVVIDGKSVFYRGYYAMPTLATSDGTPTGGVYGFAVLALEILKKLKPDYVVVAWDKSKTNLRIRRKLYPQYKANRKPAPPDFYEQIPVLEELLEAFGWPFLEVDDYEADDIMGVLSEQANEQGVESVLVTGDRDALQLVDQDTKVCLTKRGLSEIELYDEAAVKEKYGLTPKQIIDLKALQGDASDNIPGVGGVGEKTALELVQKFGSLEALYERLDEVKDSLRAKLERDRDMAFLSKQLVTIMLDAPVKLDLKAAAMDDANTGKIYEIMSKLEFKRLLDQLPEYMQRTLEEKAVPVQKKSKTKLETIEDAATLSSRFAKSKQLALFTLSAPGTPHYRPRPLAIVLSSRPEEAVLVKIDTDDDLKTVAASLKGLLEDPKIEKIGHDLKHDFKAWLPYDIELAPVGFDVMVGAFLLNALVRQQSLAELAEHELGLEMTIDREGLVDESNAVQIMDALWGLHETYRERLKKLPEVEKVGETQEWPLIPILGRMEARGIKLDVARMQQLSEELSSQIEQLERDIHRLAGQEFNISSPQQLAVVLFEKLRLPTHGVKKTKQGYSTAANELDKLRSFNPIIDMISSYREVTKLKGTYVDTLPGMVDEQSRLHTVFRQTIAQTGRLSSDQPNLMNIPVKSEFGRLIRTAFVAEPGNVFVSADYSQFELRLVAAMAEDENMIHAFNQGVDIHIQTAAVMFDIEADKVTKDQRRAAKTVNFAVMYGLSPHGLAEATGMTHEQAKEFIARYFEVRKPIKDYMETLKQQAKKDGYVETIFGRRRPMPDIHSSNFMVRSAAERAAMNMPIQGTEADLMKLAMIEVEGKLPKGTQMLLQIHDSLLVETPKQDAEKVGQILKETMEQIHKLPVKLDVDIHIGKNWGEL